jgi:hypothetical protein
VLLNNVNLLLAVLGLVAVLIAATVRAVRRSRLNQDRPPVPVGPSRAIVVIAALGALVAVAVGAVVLLKPIEVRGQACGRALLNRGSGPREFNEFLAAPTCHGRLVRNQALGAAAATLATCLAAVVVIERRGTSLAARGRRTLEIGLVALAATVGGLVVAYSRWPCETFPGHSGTPDHALLVVLLAPFIGGAAVVRALATHPRDRLSAVGLALGLCPFAALLGLRLGVLPFLQTFVNNCGA